MSHLPLTSGRVALIYFSRFELKYFTQRVNKSGGGENKKYFDLKKYNDNNLLPRFYVNVYLHNTLIHPVSTRLVSMPMPIRFHQYHIGGTE